MRFDTLQQSTTALFAQLRQAEREYTLPGDHILHVEMVIDCPHDANEAPLEASLFVWGAGEDGELDRRPLSTLPAATIVKVAEIKAMVDDWLAGKTDTLPPSTSTRLAAELERHVGAIPFPRRRRRGS